MLNTITINDLIKNELGGLYGTKRIEEMNNIIKCYNTYEGKDDDLVWTEDYDQDFECTKKNHNFIKELIDRQSSFMFGFTPTFECLTDSDDSTLTEYVNKVLKANKFSSKLLKAEKDCAIGKRIAIKLVWDEKKKKIKLRFANSLEFVYETDEEDVDEVSKVIFVYEMNNEEIKENQRIFKQKYEMVKGMCYCEEGIYNGLGELVELRRPFSSTGLDFMPVYVVLNGGLSGDIKGTSDVMDLVEDQRDYNRLDSGDTDALIKGMFESIFGIDVSTESAKKIKKAPGMYYDITTDPSAKDEGGKAELGVLSYTFSYVAALEGKLARAKQNMFSTLDIPLVTPTELQGFITSGKGLKGLYWQQIVRCEGKMMEWKPALEWIADSIIKITQHFAPSELKVSSEYNVVVTNRYALPDDKEGDLANDLLQVNAQAMSRKDFIVKWAEVTPEQADEILDQIVKEAQLLEGSSYMGMEGDMGQDPMDDERDDDDTDPDKKKKDVKDEEDPEDNKDPKKK